VRVIVNVSIHGPDRPPPGVAVRVEARDTSLQDAAAVIVGRATASVDPGEPRLASVEDTIDPMPDMCTAWVHVDVDGDGRVSAGDYITMEAFPVPPRDGAEVEVVVRRV
jgi:hypothetical protein